MAGRLFRWAAPLFARAARRWSEDDAVAFARLLGPGLQPGGRLLDLGGGTGDLASLLARVVPCHVTVADRSPQMLRYARRRAGVDAVEADAAALPFDAAAFDAALVCDAFHHFADQPRCAGELARVVRASGTVVVAEIDPRARATRLAGFVERLLGEPAAFLAPDEMQGLMASAGIDGSCERHGPMSYAFRGEVLGRSDSVDELWRRFVAEHPEETHKPHPSWHFCDNQADADELAALVLAGRKRATAGALWSYEAENEPLPQIGDLDVITDWEGLAQCIIRITGVEVVPFDQVGADFAATEGEGDGSLTYWRAAHEAAFGRELAALGRRFSPDMPVVCQRFEVVFGRRQG